MGIIHSCFMLWSKLKVLHNAWDMFSNLVYGIWRHTVWICMFGYSSMAVRWLTELAHYAWILRFQTNIIRPFLRIFSKCKTYPLSMECVLSTGIWHMTYDYTVCGSNDKTNVACPRTDWAIASNATFPLWSIVFDLESMSSYAIYQGREHVPSIMEN